MKISLDFNEVQAKAFKEFLTSGLASLDAQNAQLSKAASILSVEEQTAITNIQAYLEKTVIPQQIIVAEILESIDEAEKPKPMIISGYNNKIY